MLCDNCLHKPVCGKFRATGGQVQKCDHLLEQKHGYNIDQDTPSLFECSVCHWCCTDTYYGDTADYNYCPNCGSIMDLPRITDQTMAALEKMGEQVHGEREITSE